MDPRIDRFFNDAKRWKEESQRLREVLRDCKLTEEFKWGKACYTFNGKNIAIIQPMKGHVALMFFKGALLKDPAGALEKPGENSRSSRRVCFTNVQEVVRLEPALRAYVDDAIEVEKAGLKVTETTELVLVEELQQRLDRDPALKASFERLSPGRRRAYNLYFSAPKQSSTRTKRIERYVPKMLSGKGFRD